MAVDVNYTDINRTPLGVLSKYSIDEELGGNNDFEIQMNLIHHCMTQGSIWYVDDTEYGGIVDSITVDTYRSIVYYRGRSWRGILDKKIIRPDSGQDYLIVSGEANDVIWAIIQRLNLNNFFTVPEDPSQFSINNYQFDRYTTGYAGLMKMLAGVGAKLQFRLVDSYVVVEAVPIYDLSNTYEYSDDYGMKVIIEDDQGGINHLICLGAGELRDRVVVDLYVNAQGEIVTTQYFKGVKEIAQTYDYGNSASVEELIESGTENLEELKSKSIISAEFQKLEVGVGDIVGGKNRMTNITIKETVTKEIINIKNGVETVTYEVGER